MVDKIYDEYVKLCHSSAELEKMINMFLYPSGEESAEEKEGCDNLDRNTFNYLIETDETIKNIVRVCERRISPRYQNQFEKMKIICSMVNPDDDDFENYES